MLISFANNTRLCKMSCLRSQRDITPLTWLNEPKTFFCVFYHTRTLVRERNKTKQKSTFILIYCEPNTNTFQPVQCHSDVFMNCLWIDSSINPMMQSYTDSLGEYKKYDKYGHTEIFNPGDNIAGPEDIICIYLISEHLRRYCNDRRTSPEILGTRRYDYRPSK